MITSVSSRVCGRLEGVRARRGLTKTLAIFLRESPATRRLPACISTFSLARPKLFQCIFCVRHINSPTKQLRARATAVKASLFTSFALCARTDGEQT